MFVSGLWYRKQRDGAQSAVKKTPNQARWAAWTARWAAFTASLSLSPSSPPPPLPAAGSQAISASPSSATVVMDPYALFTAAYDSVQAPQFTDELLAAMRVFLFTTCRKLRVSEHELARYHREVQAEALGHKDELLDSIAESAVLMWTSAKRLTLQPGNSIEFCSLINRVLREHDPDLLPSACVVVRGINLLCVMRRDETKLLYALHPPQIHNRLCLCILLCEQVPTRWRVASRRGAAAAACALLHRRPQVPCSHVPRHLLRRRRGLQVRRMRTRQRATVTCQPARCCAVIHRTRCVTLSCAGSGSWPSTQVSLLCTGLFVLIPGAKNR